MEDAAVAAFAVFTTQSPSFLAYQRTMEQTRGLRCAQTLFGMRMRARGTSARAMVCALSTFTAAAKSSAGGC